MEHRMHAIQMDAKCLQLETQSLPKSKECCGFKNLYLPPVTVMFNKTELRAEGGQLVATILALGRQKQENCYRFKVHIVRPVPTRARLWQKQNGNKSRGLV